MNRKILWSVSGLLTFVVGVGAAWVFYYSPPERPRVEGPPCRSCASIYASAPSRLQILSYGDLASDPSRYNNQVVRTRALVKHDESEFFLRDFDGQDRNGYAVVEFDPSLRACDGAQKVFDDLLGHKHECWKHPAGFDGTAGSILVGRVEGLGNTGGSRFHFIVLCVEEAFPVYPDNWH